MSESHGANLKFCITMGPLAFTCLGKLGEAG